MKEMIIRWDEECPDGYMHSSDEEVNDLDLARFSLRLLGIMVNNPSYGAVLRKEIIKCTKQWEELDNETNN